MPSRGQKTRHASLWNHMPHRRPTPTRWLARIPLPMFTSYQPSSACQASNCCQCIITASASSLKFALLCLLCLFACKASNTNQLSLGSKYYLFKTKYFTHKSKYQRVSQYVIVPDLEDCDGGIKLMTACMHCQTTPDENNRWKTVLWHSEVVLCTSEWQKSCSIGSLCSCSCSCLSTQQKPALMRVSQDC